MVAAMSMVFPAPVAILNIKWVGVYGDSISFIDWTILFISFSVYLLSWYKNLIIECCEVITILGTKKFKQRIVKINAEIGSYYKKIQDCHENVKNKDFDNRVPFVSELIDFVVLFFDGCFNNLASGFGSIEEFSSSNVKYNHLRNWLSHPASSKINIDDVKYTLIFIKKVLNNISSSYFWFVPKKKIYEWCEELLSKIEDSTIKYHNLSDISFNHQKLIEREVECIFPVDGELYVYLKNENDEE